MSLSDIFTQAFTAYNQEQNNLTNNQTKAASRIQAAYKAFTTRKNYKIILNSALTIQASKRRFSTVKLTQQIYDAVQYQKRFKFYSENAIKIQKLWRGRVVRKHILDIKQRKLNIASYTLQAAYQADYCKQHFKICEEVEKQNEFEKIAKLRQEMGKLHHLTSTKAIPGVFKACYPKIQPTIGGKDIDLIVREQGQEDARKGCKTLQKQPFKILENLGVSYYK